MEQDQENDYNQKFNGGVWKRIVKEFAFFKLLFISGFIFSGLEGICAIAQPKITNYVIDQCLQCVRSSRYVFLYYDNRHGRSKDVQSLTDPLL